MILKEVAERLKNTGGLLSATWDQGDKPERWTSNRLKIYLHSECGNHSHKSINQRQWNRSHKTRPDTFKRGCTNSQQHGKCSTLLAEVEYKVKP